MSNYGIIRMQKFKMTDVQGIQKHNQRQGKSKSNVDIDYEKSDENYDLLNDQNLKYESEIKRKISERVKRKTRADSVVLSEFLVTASPEFMHALSEAEQRNYFEQALAFIWNRYGKENTLYAVVHHDEQTPHMHVGVIPITEDNRLSAKNIFNPTELKSLQSDFPEHMRKNGFEVERGKTSDRKHFTPQEYKAKKDLEKEIEQLQAQKENEVAELKVFKEPEKMLEKVEKSLKKSLISNKVSLPSADYERLKALALSSVKTKHELDKVKRAVQTKIERLEASVMRAERAEKQVDALTDLVDELNEYKTDAIVLKSKLEDAGELVYVSELEKKGRLIMYNLETGHKPKDENEGKLWFSILEDNKKAGHIPENRLKAFLDVLKRFLEKYLGFEQKFNMEAVKRQNERLGKQHSTNRQKSREMER